MPVLTDALRRHRPRHALPGAFAVDPDIYRHEFEAIWRSSWLCVGIAGQAREPGDFFRVAIGPYSLIICRNEKGVLHALHNTCRHRGMPVCDADSGSIKRWVCPYHQWSYGLDGRLLTCGGMEPLAGEESGLRRVPLAEISGLVFVWLDGDPEPIEPAAAELARPLSVQGLDRARVAHQQDYEVRANWKLVWENNRECWHCHNGHPQYIRANFDLSPDNDHTRSLIAARMADHATALAGLGSPALGHAAPGLFPFPTPGRWWSVNRTPLAPGFVTESVDGEPVAPLMGDYANYDVGTLRVRGVPNFWCHASADHAVLTWLAPDGPGLTRIRVLWLVDADSVEDRDYSLERLLPFWQLTSEQDWHLCERNQIGVANPAFTPGPLSPSREYNVISFLDWYLQRLARPAVGG